MTTLERQIALAEGAARGSVRARLRFYLTFTPQRVAALLRAVEKNQYGTFLGNQAAEAQLAHERVRRRELETQTEDLTFKMQQLEKELAQYRPTEHAPPESEPPLRPSEVPNALRQRPSRPPSDILGIMGRRSKH